MISKIFSLRNYVIKQIMKTTDEGIMQIPNKGKIDFGEMMIKEDLFRKGIDPKTITSEKQLDNILNTPHVSPKVKPKKSGEVINVDFDKGRWKDIDPEKKAYGGIAGMLGERTGFKRGTKPQKKKKLRRPPPSWRMEMEPPGYRKVYESLEDIPKEALALMKKDPNFDLQTFLETVKWSDPEETRFKKIKKHGKYSEDDIPWGTASPWGQYLNYLPFGEKESIGDGLLSLKTPSDMDKVSTVMHEMRHSKMKEPWFGKSSAVPKWVQEYEEKKLPHYLDKDIKDKHSQYRDTQRDVSGEELYTRFLDQHFYPDAAKKGELAGSDYEPYFDKILKDKWASNLKAYKDILKEEKRVLSKPIFRKNPDERKVDTLAHGGRTGTGLNYLLGEDDQNVRVPFKDGTKFDPKRRTVLKGIAALATLPIIGKYFKWAKPLAKVADVTSVPIKAGVDGMPLWFKPLVNKVIKEGDDVTKKFATADREIVHKTQLPDSKTDVLVTQDLNTGNVSVEIGLSKHGFPDGHFGQPVRLEYKAAEDIMTGPDMDEMVKTGMKKEPHVKTQTKTKEEFWVEEAEFTGGHPENIKFEESSFEKFGQHGSNFDEVEKFATGKVKKVKPTKKKLRTEYESGKAEADAERWTDDLDMASGGRVPMIFGGSAGLKALWKKMMMAGGPKTKTLFPKLKEGPRALAEISDPQTMESIKSLNLQQLENILETLKLDKRLIAQIAENKAMKDPGLDFLMGKMKENKSFGFDFDQLAKYTDIDNDIMVVEQMIKNKTMKGRKPNATGGRVPLAEGEEVDWIEDPDDMEEILKAIEDRIREGLGRFQTGGRVPLGGGGIALKILKLLKNPKKVRAAVDDIFSTGDYKMDAEMAAEALVENNPAAFGGKLIDDIDDATRSKIYGAVLEVVQSDLAKTLQLKRLSRPTKTLEGIKKTGTINISDPNVADEFTRFMKETDPKGHKKIEEIVEITNFDPKGKKGHASGGLAGMLGE